MEEVELKEQSCLWACSCLVDSVLLEETSMAVRETLLEEREADQVRRELSARLVESVLQEVVDCETHLVVGDTYRCVY